MAITSGSSWLAGTGLGSYNPNRGAPLPTYPSTSLSYVPPAPVATIVSAPTPPIVAGIEPQAYEAILYGKDIPLFVGGKMLIGGRICEGPFFGGTPTDPTVSFIAYHAQNIIGELFSDTVITSARLRGQEVWNAASGYIATDKVPSGSFAWNPGHVTNVAFPQSVGRNGSSAVPYTMGITSSWENIPLKPFGGIVPFPSMLVENSSYGDPADGITRNQAITNVLQRMGLQSFEFEVDVSGSDPAWMVATNMSLPEFLGQLRAIFTQYQITHSDKLRIIEPASFEVAGELTNSNVLRDSLKFKRTDPMTLTREKRYTFIDVDRDYEMNTALAKEDRYPIPTTDGTASASIELPIATTAAQAVADIHNSLYDELKSRSQMDGIADRTLFGLECGDGVRFADSPVINMIARVMETVHDFENMTVQFRAAEVLNCGAVTAPEVGLMECQNDKFVPAVSTTTFTSADFGIGDINRHIVVAIELRLTPMSQTITSVTIGGVSATQAVAASYVGAGGLGAIAAVWHANVPTGTSGSVVINASDVFDQASIHVYRVVSNSFAVSDTAAGHDGTALPVGVLLDVPEGGIAIASGICRIGATFTWSGATESCTFANDLETTGQRSSALYEATAAETGYAISITPSSIDIMALSVASFTV